MEAGIDRLPWMREYHITAHTELHMTCRKMFTDYSMARANYCFILFLTSGWKLAKMILNFLSNHANADVCFTPDTNTTKYGSPTVVSFYFSPETALQMCQTDVLSSSLSSFLQNYETNQPVTTLRTSHFSFIPVFPPLKKRQLASLPWCFIFHVLNLMKRPNEG